ncbi:MAG: hypothetical protein RL846_04055, partial [Deltaproteobacteria bacterium]
MSNKIELCATAARCIERPPPRATSRLTQCHIARNPDIRLDRASSSCNRSLENRIDRFFDVSARRGREGMVIDTPTRELIERAAKGDAVAQSQLVDPYLEVVVTWATRLCGPRLDPEDIAHEVFIVAL